VVLKFRGRQAEASSGELRYFARDPVAVDPRSSRLVRREMSLLNNPLVINSDKVHVGQAKPVVIPSIELKKSLLVLQVRHPESALVLLLLAVLRELKKLLSGGRRSACSALGLESVDLLVHVGEVLLDNSLKFGQFERVQSVGEMLLEPGDAVQPLLGDALLHFVLSVHSVVARAGFAKAQGISAVFVQGSGVVALLFGDKLLDLVQFGRHLGCRSAALGTLVYLVGLSHV
jgi:hypothetical protein